MHQHHMNHDFHEHSRHKQRSPDWVLGEDLRIQSPIGNTSREDSERHQAAHHGDKRLLVLDAADHHFHAALFEPAIRNVSKKFPYIERIKNTYVGHFTYIWLT